MKRAALALLMLAAPLTAQEQPELPAFLAGAWEQRTGDTWADEFWTPPRGGMMIGAARIGRGEVLREFEHTRIVRKPDGSLSFFAQPRGVPPTEFPLVASGPQMVEFASAAHDYPQRIRYWREGRLLKARISKMDGSDAMEWSYSPIAE
ncbi:MAG: hypothetical protein B7Z08_12105 [Sphingomonadales bacterium 32-68-7]|nr:MAG: hypothetical protein B7Z33_04135 [Sphingomonadales bacterium 12-68-11]OYX07596.1 MAG: hypothetical protein B7Z08_12105 [Sphingomonadales bacterium 32-68-7]